jgi:MSHA biogenesis protein MshE
MQRVDGLLQEQVIDGRRVAGRWSRLKLKSGLDIAEKRLPQDGRFTVKVKKSPSMCVIDYADAVR